MIFIIAFLIAFFISILLTIYVKKIAIKNRILDVASKDTTRKIHTGGKPLLGGLAVYLSFVLVSMFFYFFHPLLSSNIPLINIVGIWIGGAILVFGGVLDDIYDYPPSKQLIFPILAVLLIIISGIGIPHITNPFGGKIILGGPNFVSLPILSALFVFLWIIGMTYTTKFLDGIDGLASSIGIIASLSLFALSFTPAVMQDYTALLSIIIAGSLAGFLVFNWHPAKIFLGESGSLFIGFILGIISIISGGKIATAFLVMGLPILDVVWVIFRRLLAHKSPFKGDRGHMHFRLYDLGLSQKRIVFIYVTVSLIFGFTAVIMQSIGKLFSLGILVLVVVFGGFLVVRLNKKRAVDLIGNKRYS